MGDPLYINHVDRLWPELTDLFAVGERVEALAESAAWGDVAAILDAEAAKVTASLNQAREPLTQAEYAMAHGRLDGLSAARRAVDAIIRLSRERLEEQRQAHEAAGESVAGGS